ncbi:transcription termination/antitermination protein NusA [Candidatus Falkowbacteria bacterium]|nr:transcription termination/antitermination protein NusA [Candidatus Falkowbacteria bacterium]
MSELTTAIRTVCDEKGLSYDSVIETIELALAAAYRKDYGQKNQNIKVEFDPETGKSKVMDVKTVVEDLPEDYDEEKAREADEDDEDVRRFNPKTEIQLSDAKLIKKDAKLEDEIITDLEVPSEYGRMAAQTAKQVIIQKLREAEREMVFSEFKDKENEVVSGVVQRREGRNVLVDLGKAVGRILPEDQIPGEKYLPGEKIKVHVREVRSGSKGAEIILSRTSEEILKKVFYLEIPEIANGLLEIKGVAREAGSRSKVAIWTDQDNVDPIGSCVGQRGSRIQTIISELGGERVDMVEWDEDQVKFIANALSPAKILSVELDEEEKTALVKVAADQLSLAIGKRGQNVRLAARLTGWKIDIMEEGDGTSVNIKADDNEEEKEEKEEEVKNEKEEKKEEVKEKSEKEEDKKEEDKK